MEQILVKVSSLVGLQPMDLLALITTIWAAVKIKQSWRDWKKLSVIEKNLVILPTTAAILFIVASFIIHLGG